MSERQWRSDGTVLMGDGSVVSAAEASRRQAAEPPTLRCLREAMESSAEFWADLMRWEHDLDR